MCIFTIHDWWCNPPAGPMRRGPDEGLALLYKRLRRACLLGSCTCTPPCCPSVLENKKATKKEQLPGLNRKSVIMSKYFILGTTNYFACSLSYFDQRSTADRCSVNNCNLHIVFPCIIFRRTRLPVGCRIWFNDSVLESRSNRPETSGVALAVWSLLFSTIAHYDMSMLWLDTIPIWLCEQDLARAVTVFTAALFHWVRQTVAWVPSDGIFFPLRWLLLHFHSNYYFDLLVQAWY